MFLITDPREVGLGIAKFWRTYERTPYLFGGESRAGIDCSGLIRRGWFEFEVWPFDIAKTPAPQDADATADMIWRSCPKVLFEARRAGDAVCYGTAERCTHVVGVLDEDYLIGANSGRPFRAEERDAAGNVITPAETLDEYREAMRLRDARVKVVPSSYWLTKRLGVVRAPRLLELDYSTPGHLKDR